MDGGHPMGMAAGAFSGHLQFMLEKQYVADLAWRLQSYQSD
jgi:hypothetical protein